MLLGSVHSVKQNGGRTYVGTDIGFNVLARPVLYVSYHEIEVYGHSERVLSATEPVTVVGNVGESGEIIAKERALPLIEEGAVLGVADAGAFGMAMSSNYNCRLRPAEVLITAGGEDTLIRSRECLEDLTRQFSPGE